MVTQNYIVPLGGISQFLKTKQNKTKHNKTIRMPDSHIEETNTIL